jgi:hypothetical protein
LAGFTPAAETQALVGLVGDGTTDKNNYISLHTGDPGDNGDLEVVGGAYAREQTDWQTPANSQAIGTSVTIEVPAGTTITHWGLWSAAAAGTFLYGNTLPAPESFGSNGNYSVTPTLGAGD